MTKLTKRGLIRAGLATAVAAGFPTVVPSTVFGQYAPSKRINVGAIGNGASRAATTCPRC